MALGRVGGGCTNCSVDNNRKWPSGNSVGLTTTAERHI